MLLYTYSQHVKLLRRNVHTKPQESVPQYNDTEAQIKRTAWMPTIGTKIMHSEADNTVAYS